MKLQMSEENILVYLDEAIRFWREGVIAGESNARCYVDAYQSVRKSLFGETLPVEHDHFLIMSRYGDYHIGCCSFEGIDDVLEEEPGVTFEPVKISECPNCKEDDE